MKPQTTTPIVFLKCLPLIVASSTWLAASLGRGAEMGWVRVSEDGQGFVSGESSQPFVPWGFNYDHEGDGQLLEDYWDDQWPTVESAFWEMRALGANIVRIHLQFGRFMSSPTEPREASLAQLARLVQLAERTGLYLDLTGLGCYHKQDVPPWYDQLSESRRWSAQARFWQAIASTCAGSPAIFCYDLMNEPVVPGGDKPRDDWLGPAFAGKHFVQFIALDRKGRKRTDVALQWIRQLVTAIRQHDKRHLITVGLVPWSLDRPGLTSGFVPDQVATELDFISMHIYPEKGKVDEAIETVRGFAAAGKPVVIEETFVLKCGAEELSEFIDRSRAHAAGWIGFYWGRMPNEIRPAQTIPEAFTISWLELFQRQRQKILGQTLLNNGVTAHRGNSGEFPENTLVAFQSGIDVGADWIELDIFLSQDGQVVVTHDRTTKRVGDRDLVIAKSTYAELAKVDVATEFRRNQGLTLLECPPQRIPLLKDVLQLVMKQDGTRVSIQPKMACVEEAMAVIKSLHAQRWVGFNDGNLEFMSQVKQLDAEVPVFWDRGPDSDIAEDVRIARQLGFEALVLHKAGATPEKIMQIKAAGIEAGAWVVNDAATMRQVLAAGVQRIYTDYPSRLLLLKQEP